MNIFLALVGFFFIYLNLLQLTNLWKNTRLHRLLDRLYPYRITSSYGLFAVMTTDRYEFTIEGCNEDKKWKEYSLN